MTYKLFTYGTLMRGQSRHSALDDCPFLGDAVLDDYGLKETGSYPAAVPLKGFKVHGEVYEVDDEIKRLIDRIEGEGSLYACKAVDVTMAGHHHHEQVLFYEYLRDASHLPLRIPDGKWSPLRHDVSDQKLGC